MSIPALVGGRVVRTWWGFEGFTPDNMPVVGPLPGIAEVRPATEEEVYAQVVASKAELDTMKIHNPEKKAHVLMGLVMPALRGRVEGAAVLERVRAAAEGTC